MNSSLPRLAAVGRRATRSHSFTKEKWRNSDMFQRAVQMPDHYYEIPIMSSISLSLSVSSYDQGSLSTFLHQNLKAKNMHMTLLFFKLFVLILASPLGHGLSIFGNPKNVKYNGRKPASPQGIEKRGDNVGSDGELGINTACI